jgi:hypothetical protein
MPVVAVVIAFSPSAPAEARPRTSSALVGLDVRTDLGTHPARIPFGIRVDNWKATLVLDPMYALDGEHDLDVIGEYFADRFGLLIGWRWSQMDLAEGHHHQQRSLVGLTALGPELFSGRVQTSVSLELATLWVKYGGDTPTQWIPDNRNLIDHFAFGLFVRMEYALAL